MSGKQSFSSAVLTVLTPTQQRYYKSCLFILQFSLRHICSPLYAFLHYAR